MLFWIFASECGRDTSNSVVLCDKKTLVSKDVFSEKMTTTRNTFYDG